MSKKILAQVKHPAKDEVFTIVGYEMETKGYFQCYSLISKDHFRVFLQPDDYSELDEITYQVLASISDKFTNRLVAISLREVQSLSLMLRLGPVIPTGFSVSYTNGSFVVSKGDDVFDVLSESGSFDEAFSYASIKRLTYHLRQVSIEDVKVQFIGGWYYLRGWLQKEGGDFCSNDFDETLIEVNKIVKFKQVATLQTLLGGHVYYDFEHDKHGHGCYFGSFIFQSASGAINLGDRFDEALIKAVSLVASNLTELNFSMLTTKDTYKGGVEVARTASLTNTSFASKGGKHA